MSGLKTGCSRLSLPKPRVQEASSRPRREYKPKPREPLDLGEAEQSNGGFPCTPAPKITGNKGGVGLAVLELLRARPLWGWPPACPSIHSAGLGGAGPPTLWGRAPRARSRPHPLS